MKLHRDGVLTDTKTLTSNEAQRLTSKSVKEHEVESSGRKLTAVI